MKTTITCSRCPFVAFVDSANVRGETLGWGLTTDGQALCPACVAEGDRGPDAGPHSGGPLPPTNLRIAGLT